MLAAAALFVFVALGSAHQILRLRHDRVVCQPPGRRPGTAPIESQASSQYGYGCVVGVMFAHTPSDKAGPRRCLEGNTSEPGHTGVKDGSVRTADELDPLLQ